MKLTSVTDKELHLIEIVAHALADKIQASLFLSHSLRHSGLQDHPELGSDVEIAIRAARVSSELVHQLGAILEAVAARQTA